MDHTDHVNLLRAGVEGAGPTWADFGAGSGAFTLALADILGPEAEIHAVDRDAGALRANVGAMRARFPGVNAHHHHADFSRPLALPELDGLVMANSLHFQRYPAPIVQLLAGYLRPGGRFVIVEYNITRSNPAVPHPVPFEAWQRLAADAGFEHTELLVTRPSRFLNEIYSAVSS